MADQWYESFFRNYARKYEQESFTKGTLGECDFIVKESSGYTPCSILDIGCGTGRHSLELARRGFDVTGLDLSNSMPDFARHQDGKESPRIHFILADARNFTLPQKFEMVIMLCEGAFPLMETDEMNFRILQNAYHALKQEGKIIFTTLNGLFPLFHSVKEFLESHKGEGNADYNKGSFDLMTFRDHSKVVMEDDSGVQTELECNERYYVPSEIHWLLASLGFHHIH